MVASAGDLLRYHRALRLGELLSDGSWTAMRTVEPGLYNGLGYLVGQGEFGRYEGNVGRAMGHVAANVYYPDPFRLPNPVTRTCESGHLDGQLRPGSAMS